MNMQQRQPIIFPASNLHAQVVEQIARTRELISQALELLKEPTPDIFLGRKHHNPFPLPHEKQ